MSECKAEKQAVGRFAAPDRLATKFDRFTAPFRLLFLLASLATTGVGLWLLWVIGFVLPTRDPAHIPLWRGVALACFLYSGLCWSYLVLGPRKRLIRWLVFGISVPAVGLGLYGIIHMIRVANGGGHFEGYIVLMGLILAVHGATAICYTILTGKPVREIRAA